MKGANVLCSDPYIKMKNLKSANEVLKKCEYVFIPVMHDEYLKLNFEKNKVIDFFLKKLVEIFNIPIYRVI